MKAASTLVVALLLAGCGAKVAPTMVCFDRAELGMTVADLGGPLRVACATGKLPKDECEDLGKADKNARKAILMPAKEDGGTSAIVTLLLKIGSAAARAYGFPVPPPQ